MFVSDSTTPPSESGGHTVLSGHRDTIFTTLGELKKMDNLIVEDNNKVYTYEIHKMWITNADDLTVNSHIRNLRNKLGHKAKYITTVVGIRYKFLGDV